MIPTREAGLARLHDFTPRMGRAYAVGRNTDPGPGRRSDVSGLSPYIRRRLITEAEVVRAAWTAHGEGATKFIEEVFWRSYWKGWLEQHPSVWRAYLAELHAMENRLAVEGGLRRIYHDACDGRSGIDCFDAWALELVQTGSLHNHARMWFASIWIFTLRLPWTLGAAFFLRHLLDGDPASNTLSWRWVAGLHTKGKHYVARAENIARHTEGRFHPVGVLDEAPEPLTEATVFPLETLLAADSVPEGDFDLLLHEEDLHPESLELDLRRARRVALVCGADGAEPVVGFARGAAEDTARRLAGTPILLGPAGVTDWIRAYDRPVVTPWAPVGPVQTLLAPQPQVRLRRRWDQAVWPHATRGYFQVRAQIGAVLETLQPAAVEWHADGQRSQGGST
jgi:deoxyribodipyrimidine photo-lyase